MHGPREPEVCNLDVVHLAGRLYVHVGTLNEDILQLQVSVKHFVRVHVANPVQQLPGDVFGSPLVGTQSLEGGPAACRDLGLELLVEVAVARQVHDDDAIASLPEGIVQIDNPRMVQVPHDVDLPAKGGQLALGVFTAQLGVGDHLRSIGVPGKQAFAHEHRRLAAVAHLGAELEQVPVHAEASWASQSTERRLGRDGAATADAGARAAVAGPVAARRAAAGDAADGVVATDRRTGGGLRGCRLQPMSLLPPLPRGDNRGKKQCSDSREQLQVSSPAPLRICPEDKGTDSRLQSPAASPRSRGQHQGSESDLHAAPIRAWKALDPFLTQSWLRGRRKASTHGACVNRSAGQGKCKNRPPRGKDELS
mmetsp:Transcript_152872/g.490390  ORF Transcript_152872/g.490390 Transcript_152872/m.490390 type:complete len:366 (+) Transcript_152872:1243-2340(+)